MIPVCLLCVLCVSMTQLQTFTGLNIFTPFLTLSFKYIFLILNKIKIVIVFFNDLPVLRLVYILYHLSCIPCIAQG